jgi:hypothetical protein
MLRSTCCVSSALLRTGLSRGRPDRRHRRPFRFRTHAANLRGRCHQCCLANLVRQLADAYGPRGVTVHMIAPGALDTDRLRRFAGAAAQARGASVETVLDEYRSHSPPGRMTTVDQVAWAATQLLAPEADALHGATLALDGGAHRQVEVRGLKPIQNLRK